MRRLVLRLAPTALLVAAAMAACSGGGASSTGTAATGGGGHAGQGGHGGGAIAVTAIHIQPADTVQDLAYGVGATVDFKALGTPVGGGADVPVDADFAFDVPTVGAFSGPTFTASAKAGGKGTVTATYGGQSATTTLTVNVHLDVVEDGLSPDLVGQVLAAAPDASLAPAWSYPEEGVVIPPNVYGVAWSWSGAPGADAYLLRLSGPRGVVDVLSKQLTHTFDDPTWDSVVGLLGSGPLTGTVYGFASADPSKAGASPRSFRFAGAPLKGAMYYWSSKGDYAPVQPNEDQTAPRGYFRYDFTSSVGGQAELFLGFNRAGDTCVGCHSVARDGTLFATSFGGDTHWAALDVSSKADPVAWSKGGPSDATSLGNFNAFTPDGKWLLVSGGSTLRAFDLSAPGTVLAASFDAPLPASHIAVSPKNGSDVYYVEDLTGAGGTHVGRGRIVRVTWDAAAKSFSNRTIVLEDPSASVYYPAVSPDGAWLLYDRAVSGDSLSNAGAEVWAMKLDGSAASIALAAANQLPQQSNSWPRWAPFIADDGEGHPRYFLTFSSVRPYQGTGVPQLWLATFDPAAAAGADPSTPALWLPMQSTTLHNHAAQWTEIFVPIPN